MSIVFVALLADSLGHAARTPVIPTVAVAPGVDLPMITMGGVHQEGYPDVGNYSLWLELGGRGFDSAWEYRTEGEIRDAIVDSGIAREKVFITTKIPGSLHGGCCGCPRDGRPPAAPSPPLGPSDYPPCIPNCRGVCFPKSGHYTPAQALEYMRDDLEQLGDKIGYIDLLLLHQPCDFIAPYPYNASRETASIWGAMEAFFKSHPDKVRAIGVSNFDTVSLSALAKTATVTPAVNQCRMSVGGFDKATFEYCKAHNITYQAYSVLHGAGISTSATLKQIGAAHGGVSNQQVVMRWVTQKGIPLVTASNVSAYDIEDMDIFGFNLTAGEMAELDSYSPYDCKAHKTCPAVIKDCVNDGCAECEKKEKGVSALPFLKETHAAGTCGSCLCKRCCDACTLMKSKGMTYCQKKA